MALVFKLLYLVGSDEMVILGFAFLAFAILCDILTGIKKSKVFNRLAAFRFSILSLWAVTLFIVPEDFRVSITYRADPDFIQYYQEHKNKPVQEIQEAYKQKKGQAY